MMMNMIKKFHHYNNFAPITNKGESHHGRYDKNTIVKAYLLDGTETTRNTGIRQKESKAKNEQMEADSRPLGIA